MSTARKRNRASYVNDANHMTSVPSAFIPTENDTMNTTDALFSDLGYTDADYAAEQWLPIERFDGRYDVSTLSRVRSNNYLVWTTAGTSYPRPGKMMSPSMVGAGGYLQFHLTDQYGDTVKSYAHRLALAEFVGPVPSGHEVDHIDGNPLNNRLENLRYVTAAQNMNAPGRTFKKTYNSFGGFTLTHAEARAADSCRRGHSLTDIKPGLHGERGCPVCHNAKQLNYYHAVATERDQLKPIIKDYWTRPPRDEAEWRSRPPWQPHYRVAGKAA